MMSVLIPVYNRDVTQLVNDLSTQAGSVSAAVEICVMDDGSDGAYQALNSRLADKALVRYVVNGMNNGRVRIRQMLAEMAVYDWLLFLDCDSRLISRDFLTRYFNETSGTADVITGGRVYSPLQPRDCSLRLHWKYGTVRESVSLKPARVNPFMTNNFLIRKTVFQQISFGDMLQGYGYEDTWMGIQLEEMNASLRFVHNPVLHDGVEPALTFIRKSENAMRNLHALSTTIPSRVLSRHVKLFYYYNLLKRYRMLWVIKGIDFCFHRRIVDNLVSCKPSLLLFDLYRLHYFSRLAR